MRPAQAAWPETASLPEPEDAFGVRGAEIPQGHSRVELEHGAWRETLGLIAESAADLLGFGVAAISLVREDKLVTYAVACDDPAVREGILGSTTSVTALVQALEHAEDWGLMKFLPHGDVPDHIMETSWVPELSDADDGEQDAGAWHPHDILIGPLHDHDGTLVGFLAVDMPLDGRRPGPEQRRLLDRHAEQAAKAVVNVVARERLATTVELATSVRRVVREASAQITVSALMEAVQGELMRGFGAQGMWIHVFDSEGTGEGVVHAASGVRIVLPPALIGIAEETAERAWHLQEANVVGRDTPPPADLTPEELAEIHTFQRSLDIDQSLFVPLGAGRECLGNLVITRRPGQPPFTDLERDFGMDLGHDLGRAVVNTRLLERRRRLLSELRALDTYKTRLLATLAHELKNPLTSVLGYLEVLQSMDLDHLTEERLADIERSAREMSRLVEDMLARARDAARDPGAQPGGVLEEHERDQARPRL